MTRDGIDYGNEKLNEIFNLTWPNLGWAKHMEKHSKHWYDYNRNDINRENPFAGPYPDEMFEVAERREAERKALDALDRHYEENGAAFGQLAYIERLEKEEEIQRKFRSERILERYNHFYNIECSSLSHGTPITPEFQQAMTLECMLDALRCENMNHEFDVIPTADLNDLIDNLYEQGREYLKKVQEFQDSADGVV